MDPSWEPVNQNLKSKLKMDLQHITGSQDNVAFKVALKDKTSTDKDGATEIRRFAVARDVAASFVYLKAKLVQLFDRLKSGDVDYAVTWVDADGDEVVVAGDEELIIALSELTGPVYKLNVVVKGVKVSGVNVDAVNNGEVHRGVQCDNCDKSGFAGFRYKCVVCPDFDLCGECEGKGAHPGHNMVRIASPETAWPGHFFRRIHKMHERIGKRQGSNPPPPAGSEPQPEMAEEALGNPFGDWFAGHGHPMGPGGMPGRGRRCGGRFGGGFRRGGGGPRPGHQMWESMMKGWTGEQPKPKSSAEDEAKENKKEEDTTKANNDPFANLLGEQALNGSDYLRNVGNLVAAALDPFGVDVQIDIENGGQRETVKTPAKAEEAKEKEATKENQDGSIDIPVTVEKTKEAEKKEDTIEIPVTVTNSGAKPKADSVEIPVSVTDEVSNKQRSPTPDTEEDEWTVLNDQNKEEPAAAAAAAAVNVEVPIKVSDQPAEVLYGAPDGTLYPELPPKDTSKPADDIKGAAAAMEPTAPKADHADPKIQVALQAMMNMGFTNDGGWLTQLLEQKQGDIGKVLDILQPVRPVRN